MPEDKTEVSEKVKLRRRIEDYLRKYANEEELIAVAKALGVKH